MADAIIQIALPPETIEQLQQLARAQNRSVDEVVRNLLAHELPGLPILPSVVEAELAAFENLSDDVLWLLARSTLTHNQQHELADLNNTAQQRALTDKEARRQQELIELYNRTLVRRAHAASVLKERGHDVAKPN